MTKSGPIFSPPPLHLQQMFGFSVMDETNYGLKREKAKTMNFFDFEETGTFVFKVLSSTQTPLIIVFPIHREITKYFKN